VTLRRRFGVTVESEHLNCTNGFFSSGTDVYSRKLHDVKDVRCVSEVA
jgi:hypothetical protein